MLSKIFVNQRNNPIIGRVRVTRCAQIVWSPENYSDYEMCTACMFYKYGQNLTFSERIWQTIVSTYPQRRTLKRARVPNYIWKFEKVNTKLEKLENSWRVLQTFKNLLDDNSKIETLIIFHSFYKWHRTVPYVGILDFHIKINLSMASISLVSPKSKGSCIMHTIHMLDCM